MPRRPLRLVLTGVSIALLAAASSRASEKVSFSLTNTGSTPVTDVTFQPIPTGTIVPTVTGTDASGNPIEASPLTALPSSTGVDTSNAYVLLGNVDVPAGGTQDTLFLLFGYQPNAAFDPDDPSSSPFLPVTDAAGKRRGALQPGGQFDFQLSLANPADLGLIVPTSADLALSQLAATSSPVTTPSPATPPPADISTTAVPEPSTLLVWAGLVGASAWFARNGRRRPAPATTP